MDGIKGAAKDTDAAGWGVALKAVGFVYQIGAVGFGSQIGVAQINIVQISVAHGHGFPLGA